MRMTGNSGRMSAMVIGSTSTSAAVVAFITSD
jgi:hypothetical protein